MPEINWNVIKQERMAEIDSDVRNRAVRFLKENLSDDVKEEVREAIDKDPERWWTLSHFGWGMAVRNLLRANGFSEGEMGVNNLDDYYIPLVEMAVKGGEETDIVL